MIPKSLYVHIPFCIKKCSYCDFFSLPIAERFQNDESFSNSFFSAIEQEISFRTRNDPIIWNTIYVGGGTPSILNPKNLLRLEESIFIKNIRYNLNQEWTIEANPEDITQEWLLACTQIGINRISLGIQSLNDTCLKAVNRRGSRAKTLQALNLITKNWDQQLSLDLISGLPEQSEKSLLDDIYTLSHFAPDHISLYSLTVEEGTSLAKQIKDKNIRLPESESQDLLWLKGRDSLESLGYYQYEVSNFALPGFESKHNQVYWDLSSYIGVGPGATGTLIRGQTAVRYSNTTNIEKWLENPCTANTEEIISTDDCIKERIMMGFRTKKGIEQASFRARFSVDLTSLISNTIRKWDKKGLISLTDTNIALTKEGLLFLNRFLEDCFNELERA